MQCYGSFPTENFLDPTDDMQPIAEHVDELDDKDVTAVACGGYWVAALCKSGDLYTWGSIGMAGTQGNYLGHGSFNHNGSVMMVPQLLQSLAGQVKHVSCGDIMMGVITKDGRVWTWGDGDNDSLGHGDHGQHVHVPRQIESFGGHAAQVPSHVVVRNSVI